MYRPDITTMQEESSSSMISPLSDGNAHGTGSSAEVTVVKDGPHAGAPTGPPPAGQKGDGNGTVSSRSSKSPRPKGPAEEGDGGPYSVGHVCFIDKARDNERAGKWCAIPL